MARTRAAGCRRDGRDGVGRPGQRWWGALRDKAGWPGPCRRVSVVTGPPGGDPLRPASPRSRSPRVSARFSPDELACALGIFPPTDEQAAVIAAPPGPLVVIAGAGAGKTETMAARVVWLIANGYAEPGQVLGLTFTRKAAGQLLRRVRSQLSPFAGIGPGPTRPA